MIQSYSYKFRLYPTPKQEVLLSKHFGCVRWVYNHFLDRRIQHYRTAKEQDLAKKSLNYYDDANELPKLKQDPETAWLAEVGANSLQHSLKHLDSAYNQFFKKLAKFPRFKKKNGHESFRIPAKNSIKISGQKLIIPKFLEGIKIDQHREIQGKIKNATVSRTPSGRYYVSIQVEKDIQPLPSTGAIVGLDLGIKSLVVTSDGQTYPNLRPFKKFESRIRLYNQALSRRQPKSKGREKARRRLARVHERVADIRANHLHQITRRIINENQVIVLEDLNIKGMMANRKLSKAIQDCSISELVRQLEYKSKWYGREIVRVSRRFPSSKTCSKCGHVKIDLTLADREWTCPRCGSRHDRDFNAAINILNQGLNLMNLDKQKRTAGTAGIADSLGVSLATSSERLIVSEVSQLG